MSWMMRAGTAAVLAFALVALPLVLDQCAASCDAHHGATAATPRCHHAAATTTRIGQVPSPCGHDHGGTVVMPANRVTPVLPTFDSAIAVPVASVTPAGTAFDHSGQPHDPPGSSLVFGAQSLPLRV
jgi:hypothetical protein